MKKSVKKIYDYEFNLRSSISIKRRKTIKGLKEAWKIDEPRWHPGDD